MKAAGAALVAAALFFAGVLFGSQGRSVGAPIPRPVVVVATESSEPGSSGRTEPRNAPAPEELEVETVELPVEEGSVEDYGDAYENEGGSDSSGPGSGDDAPDAGQPEPEEPEPEESEPEDSPADNSGPGSDDGGPDNSGPGSSSSGSGGGGSGSGGSGSG
jgi:hypothetical protein